MPRLSLIVLLTIVLFAACSPKSASPPPVQGDDAMSMDLTSAAFTEADMIPEKYTADGPDLSPPLAWSQPPQGTKSFALVCDDPDAPVGTGSIGSSSTSHPTPAPSPKVSSPRIPSTRAPARERTTSAKSAMAAPLPRQDPSIATSSASTPSTRSWTSPRASRGKSSTLPPDPTSSPMASSWAATNVDPSCPSLWIFLRLRFPSGPARRPRPLEPPHNVPLSRAGVHFIPAVVRLILAHRPDRWFIPIRAIL